MNPDERTRFNVYVKQLGYAHFSCVDTVKANTPSGAVDAYLDTHPLLTAQTLFVNIQEADVDGADIHAFTLTLNPKPKYDVKADKLSRNAA